MMMMMMRVKVGPSADTSCVTHASAQADKNKDTHTRAHARIGPCNTLRDDARALL